MPTKRQTNCGNITYMVIRLTLKGNMKKVVAVLLSIAAGSAMASEPEDQGNGRDIDF